MNKYSRLMCDVIKASEKTDCGNKYTAFPFMTGFFRDDRYVTEGHYLIKVPNYFNDELFHGRALNDIDRFFSDIPSDILTDTGITKNITASGKNKKVHVFRNYENDIHVDESFLKYFSDCYFKGSSAKNPIYAFDIATDDCIGLVLPIYINA